MQIHLALFFDALVGTCVRAQTLIGTGDVQELPIATINPVVSTSLVAAASDTPSNLGDPTQLSNYPLCAVKQSHSSSRNDYTYVSDIEFFAKR